jgi:hypothetical protein
MKRLRWLCSTLGLLAVLACVPSAGATTWHDVLDQAAAAPTIDKATALRLYALAIGPVPGVRVSRTGLGRIDSADPALDAVLNHYKSFSAKQLHAVGLRLVRKRHHGHKAVAAQGVTNFYPTFGPVPRQEDEALTRIANRFRTLFAGRLRIRPSFAVHVYRSTFAFGRVGPIGEALPYGAGRNPSLTPVDCEIKVNRLSGFVGTSGTGGAGLEEALAHEVFHCFQAQIMGTWTRMAVVHERSPWLLEGGAEWAGCQAHVGPIAQGWFGSYLEAPQASLFARSYDAIGFYDEVAALGVDPFTTMAAALRAGDDAGAYGALAGRAEEPVEESLGASFAQDESRGAAWRIAGPCYAAKAVEPTPLTVTPDGRAVTVTAGKVAGTLDRLDLADANYVLTIEVGTGRGRISAGGIDDVIAPGADPAAQYCVGTCTCQGSATSLKTLSRSGPAVLLALTGNPADGGSATLRADPVTCLGITSATFTSSDATFTNVSNPQDPANGFQWSSSESWNVAFGRTTLSAGRYSVGTITSSGGTFTTQRPMADPCTGSLSLDTRDSPRDPWLKVTNDYGSGTARHWLISVTPTSYGNFFTTGNGCPGPDFGFNVMRPLWTATIDLHATARPTEHTETFTVASDPTHAAKENWTGTVTITGSW